MAVVSLPSRSDFDAVFNNPDAKFGHRDFLILAKKNKAPAATPVARIGFVTSKKKIKRAVDRNRFRRIFKDRLKFVESLLETDLVVIARGKPEDLHGLSFYKEVDKALMKLTASLAKSHARS